MTKYVVSSKFKIAVFITFLLLSASIYGQNQYGEGMEISLVRTHEDKDLDWGGCPSFMPEGCTVAVLHGNPASTNLDIFFKVPADYEIPSHWHTSVERMILVSGELQVTYEGEPMQTMKVGSYAYGPSAKPHTAKCVGEDPCILFIAFEEPLDAFPLEPNK